MFNSVQTMSSSHGVSPIAVGFIRTGVTLATILFVLVLGVLTGFVHVGGYSTKNRDSENLKPHQSRVINNPIVLRVRFFVSALQHAV